jgi:hypothetical protein
VATAKRCCISLPNTLPGRVSPVCRRGSAGLETSVLVRNAS